MHCEEIFTLAEKDLKLPASEIKGYLISTEGAYHDLVENILEDAARLDNILYSPNPKTRRETKEAYAFRRDRAKAVRDVLGLTQTEPPIDLDARNALMHFDERIDALILKKNAGELQGFGAAPFGLSLSSEEAIQGAYHMGTYCAREKLYVVDSATVDIGAIYKEACNVLDRYRGCQYALDEDLSVIVPL